MPFDGNLSGAADGILNSGPLSWDLGLWTSDHGPWVQVTRFTRYFVFVLYVLIVLVFTHVFQCVLALGELSGGARGRLGDH